MLRDEKGQVRVIEAFLSVLLITSALTLSTRLSPSQNVKGDNSLASIGWQTLIQLDKEGTLGEYVNEENWTSLQDALQMLLPLGVAFNLTVYDECMVQINNVSISNGLKSDDVVAVQYVCASQNPNYRCFILRLQLSIKK